MTLTLMTIMIMTLMTTMATIMMMTLMTMSPSHNGIGRISFPIRLPSTSSQASPAQGDLRLLFVIKVFYNLKKSFFLPSSQLNDMVVFDAKAETVDVAFSLTLVAKTGEQLVRGGDFQGRR